ncbi:unnamed protein product [Vitrella brassicaformis CCMP3155]|uniref:Uncharacterized protein n=1 Tax=Vitrella brassicaformis (strain CCMP3155) TaxID=1169540 RepID=A0A0G4GNY5_VITBC|nr:unnamed protein product [Vitrella brassicaformis CCMP3155]|eukprot:CEM31998.1 unnamed protein product [Vitrella brassicaformis CCMP3155]
MGLPREFNRVLHEHLKYYAAWEPISNHFVLGNWGVIENGVFVSHGNIRDLDPALSDIIRESGVSREAFEDFRSSVTVNVRTAGEGTADLQVLDGDVAASLEFKFTERNAVLFKGSVETVKILNVDEVLGRLVSLPGWKRHFRVVVGLRRGKNCTIVAAREAGATVAFGGRAEVLRKIQAGAMVAAGDFTVHGEGATSLCIVGKEGVVGLDLRRAKVSTFSFRSDNLPLPLVAPLNEPPIGPRRLPPVTALNESPVAPCQNGSSPISRCLASFLKASALCIAVVVGTPLFVVLLLLISVVLGICSPFLLIAKLLKPCAPDCCLPFLDRLNLVTEGIIGAIGLQSVAFASPHLAAPPAAAAPPLPSLIGLPARRGSLWPIPPSVQGDLGSVELHCDEEAEFHEFYEAPQVSSYRVVTKDAEGSTVVLEVEMDWGDELSDDMTEEASGEDSEFPM